MAYFSLNKITPPAPNDPVVNEATQINANWDNIDLKLQPYMIGGTISNIEVGQEFFDSNFRFAVWSSGGTRLPDDIDAGWSAWTAIPMFSPRVARTSFTPRWRSNSMYRMVELAGGVYFNAAQDPWTLGGYLTINADSSGAIPASLAPVGGIHISQAAAALTAGTSVTAGAMIYVDKPGETLSAELGVNTWVAPVEVISFSSTKFGGGINAQSNAELWFFASRAN